MAAHRRKTTTLFTPKATTLGCSLQISRSSHFFPLLEVSFARGENSTGLFTGRSLQRFSWRNVETWWNIAVLMDRTQKGGRILIDWFVIDYGWLVGDLFTRFYSFVDWVTFYMFDHWFLTGSMKNSLHLGAILRVCDHQRVYILNTHHGRKCKRNAWQVVQRKQLLCETNQVLQVLVET